MLEPTSPRASAAATLPGLHADLGNLDFEVRRRAVLTLGRVGGAESREPLELLLDETDPLLYFYVRTALDQIAARLAGNESEEPPGSEALRRGLRDGNEAERREVLGRCLAAPRTQHLAVLESHLALESSPAVLPALVRAVLAHRHEGTLDSGLKFLYHPDARVRAAAVEGFWEWEHPRVHQAVLDRRGDPSPRVKGDALVFAVLMDRRAAADQVRSMLASDKPWVRLAAVYVLGRVRREWATPLLSGVLADPHQSPVVKDLAREVVSSLSAGAMAAAPAEAADETVRNDLTRHLPPIHDAPGLVAALLNPDLLQRIHGLQNSHRFPAHVVVPVIYRMVDTEDDPLVVAALVRALGRVGGDDRMALLGKFLEHEDPRVRANALEVVSQLACELPREHLDRLLSDEVPRVRLQAASYLFARRPEDALRFFRDMVFGADPLERESALFCLAKLRDDRLVSILRDALQDRRKDVYRQAYQVLQNVASDWPGGAAVLEEFREGKVAGEVIEGEPVAALLAALDSPNPIDRVATIKKLVAAEDPRVELMLEVNLAARDPGVRLHAAQALLQRHRDKTLPRLERKLGARYLELVTGGHAVAPHALARELAPTVRDLSAVDEAEIGGDERRDQLLNLLGRELYAAWDRDVVLDESLRALCQELRVIDELMIMHAGGATRPAGVVPGTPVERAAGAVGRAELEAAVEAVANRPGPDAGGPEPAAGPTRAQRRRRRVMVGAAWAVSLAVAYLAGQYGSGTGAGAGGDGPRSATRTLDEMSLERDPARFGARFRERPVAFTGTLLNAERSGRSSQVRAGSILFRVAPSDLAQRLPEGLKDGALVDVTGRVQRLARDGTVEIDGNLRVR